MGDTEVFLICSSVEEAIVCRDARSLNVNRVLSYLHRYLVNPDGFYPLSLEKLSVALKRIGGPMNPSLPWDQLFDPLQYSAAYIYPRKRSLIALNITPEGSRFLEEPQTSKSNSTK